MFGMGNCRRSSGRDDPPEAAGGNGWMRWWRQQDWVFNS